MGGSIVVLESGNKMCAPLRVGRLIGISGRGLVARVGFNFKNVY